ncbi:hypothetical protein [Halobellus rubicundus]|uniref:Rubrerythrin-like domain-containing protein n=1 Tax=Halobellus rubicundus TaxID=2996466 RepID=A0ABD5MAE5_9EURY
MSSRRSFVCRDCGCRVTPGSFRARCPECDGELGTTDAAHWDTR